MEEKYPEDQAVERWGDGESYGCSVVHVLIVPPGALKDHPLGVHGWYCGYVRFKHDPQVDKDDVAVHGGVTFHEVDTEDGSVIYGFDCAHFMDESDPLTRDIDWLKAEVERMRASIEEQRDGN